MSVRKFYLCRQDRNMSNQAYYDKLLNAYNVVRTYNGNIGEHDCLRDAKLQKILGANFNLNTATVAQKEEALTKSTEQYLAVAMLLSADRNRYGKMIEDVNNFHSWGSSHYPATMSETLRRMNTYQGGTQYSQQNSDLGIAFVQNAKNTRKKRPKCTECGKWGHYKGDEKCPKYNPEDQTQAKSDDRSDVSSLTQTVTPAIATSQTTPSQQPNIPPPNIPPPKTGKQFLTINDQHEQFGFVQYGRIFNDTIETLNTLNYQNYKKTVVYPTLGYLLIARAR